MSVRIWQEWNFSGATTSTVPTGQFPGLRMPFEDRTDLPSLTIRNHVKGMIIERGPDVATATLDTTKPPYRVPTMSEIRALEPNGFDAVSTFSGAGGSSTGYRMAGFRMLLASEFVQAARDTYAANADPATLIDGRDIRDVTAAELLAAIGRGVGELDLLDGSPPCSAFSTAGKREAGWGVMKQYCVNPETLVLCADLIWRNAGELAIGTEIVAFDEGERLGDRRHFRPAVIESADRLVRPCYRVTTDDGTSVVCSAEHRWLVRSGHNLRWKPTSSVRPGDKLLSIGQPWTADRSYEAGYLAGIFDGEGCVSRKVDGTTRLLGFAQNRGVVLDRSVEWLRNNDVQFGMYENGKGVVHVNINGGAFAKVRVLGVLRPSRLVPKAASLWEGVSVRTAAKTAVVSVEFLGDQEVVALSTSARTFIANGLLSHNSDDKVQRVDDLFFEYARLVRDMQPRVFVAENVSGLVKGSAKGYFKLILQRLRAAGYRCTAQLVDAAWLGVPQARQRLIFVGVREDLELPPAFPTPMRYQYTVRDALPWIAGQADNGGFGSGAMRPANQPSPTIGAMPQTGNGRWPASLVDARIMHDTGGVGSAGDITDRAAPTVTMGRAGGNTYHYQVHGGPGPLPVYDDKGLPHDPETGQKIALPGGTQPGIERRRLTLGELRAIGGFPPDFVLTGSYSQRWERIGRAVPPVMMAHVAAVIRDQILIPARNRDRGGPL